MASPVPRRSKRILTAEQKYDLWTRMLSGELTPSAAAVEAGVDRSVITRLRGVARDGAIAALAASKPGRRTAGHHEDPEKAALRSEVERLERTIIEQAIELALLRGK